jgi:hypothetical protein
MLIAGDGLMTSNIAPGASGGASGGFSWGHDAPWDDEDWTNANAVAVTKLAMMNAAAPSQRGSSKRNSTPTAASHPSRTVSATLGTYDATAATPVSSDGGFSPQEPSSQTFALSRDSDRRASSAPMKKCQATKVSGMSTILTLVSLNFRNKSYELRT